MKVLIMMIIQNTELKIDYVKKIFYIITYNQNEKNIFNSRKYV